MSSSSSLIPQVQNDPILQLPFLYISGLNISVASTTVLAIAPGQARDRSDNIDLPVGFPNLLGNTVPSILFQNHMQPLLIDGATNGAGGLDSGSLIATMDYGIYLIGDSRNLKPVAGILSLTSNAYPLLPLGYDSFRLLGFIQTGGGATFVASSTNPLNARNLLCYYKSPAVSVLSGGNATSFTAIDLSTPIPTTTSRDVIAQLLVSFIPLAAGNTVQLRPTGEGTPQTNGLITIVGESAGVAQSQYIQAIAGVAGGLPEIDYKVTVGGDSVSISVVGYCYIPTSYIP